MTSDTRASASSGEFGVPKPRQGVKILVVEDEFLIAMDIETSLQDAGYDVVAVARTAEQALELARDRQPVMVIMDIRLAGQRDGVDAAIDIYRETGIRSLFATAHSDLSTVTRAAPSLPLGWLSKPYTSAVLIAKVRQALEVLNSLTKITR